MKTHRSRRFSRAGLRAGFFAVLLLSLAGLWMACRFDWNGGRTTASSEGVVETSAVGDLLAIGR